MRIWKLMFLGSVLLTLTGGLLSGSAAHSKVYYHKQEQGTAGSNYGNDLDIPGHTGCVKSCMRDSSPCDSPLYKHADNRCSNRR